MGIGIECIVAKSFGDIFLNNCYQNGLLPVCLPADLVDRLALEAARSPSRTVIDLPGQTVVFPRGHRAAFDIDELRKTALINGLDEIEQTFLLAVDIKSWQPKTLTDDLGYGFSMAPAQTVQPQSLNRADISSRPIEFGM